MKTMKTEWQPIETAPKDGTKIVGYIPDWGVVAPVWYDADLFNKKPRPLWGNYAEFLYGKKWVRNNQPTHWMPMLEEPK